MSNNSCKTNGGCLNSHGKLSLNRCTIDGCSADNSGGGIYMDTGSTLTIGNTEIKKNNYWMDVISTYVTRGIDDHTGYEQIVNAQTPETIAAFARQMLATGNRLEVVMLPEE